VTDKAALPQSQALLKWRESIEIHPAALLLPRLDDKGIQELGRRSRPGRTGQEAERQKRDDDLQLIELGNSGFHGSNCTCPPGQEKARRALFEHNGGLTMPIRGLLMATVANPNPHLAVLVDSDQPFPDAHAGNC
jgi:hypothetical protein